MSPSHRGPVSSASLSSSASREREQKELGSFHFPAGREVTALSLQRSWGSSWHAVILESF